ncbi:MAG: polyamine aminopropyltransferase [Bacteroidota bacterium]
MTALGRHVLVELYQCDANLLNDVVHIETTMEEAASNAGATLINSTFHHFSPYGVSGVIVIQESHLAIHTWPEFGFASIDIFTCGDSVDPWHSYDFLKEKLGASHGSAMEMRRGEMKLLQKSDFEKTNLRDDLEEHREQIVRSRDIWFTERTQDLAFSLKHKGEKLFDKQTDYQRVEVFDTTAFGKMLTLDGMVMCTEGDEYVYHELISHIPALTHPEPAQVLVIGGGDGGTVRELVKHPEIQKVTLVEIDEEVVNASKLYLRTISKSLDHEKVDVKIEDGIEFIKKADPESYDLIIVDSTDPVGPGEGLFTEEFYKNVYKALSPEGIMVTQSESPRFNKTVFQEINKCYKSIFGKESVFTYLGYIPTYPTGMWSFSLCSKGSLDPIKSIDQQRQNKLLSSNKLLYYNAEIHNSVFALPNFVKDLLN